MSARQLMSRSRRAKGRDRIHSSSAVPPPSTTSSTTLRTSPLARSAAMELHSPQTGEFHFSTAPGFEETNPILGDDDELHDPGFVHHTLEMMAGSVPIHVRRQPSYGPLTASTRGSMTRSTSRPTFGLGLQVGGNILGDDEALLVSSSESEDETSSDADRASCRGYLMNGNQYASFRRWSDRQYERPKQGQLPARPSSSELRPAFLPQASADPSDLQPQLPASAAAGEGRSSPPVGPDDRFGAAGPPRGSELGITAAPNHARFEGPLKPEAKVALAALSQQPASLPHLNEGRITREWDKLQRLQRDADTRALLPHSFSVKGMQTLTCTLTHQASSDFGPAVRAMRPLHMAVERGRELMAASQPQSPASRNHGRPIFNSAASASASSSASALAPAASTASAPARSRTPATTAQLPLATSPSPWTTKTIPDAFQADPRPNARSHAQAQAAVPGNHLNYGNNNRPSSAALDPAVMAARHQGPASTNLGAPLDGTSIVPHALASQGPTLPSSEASLFSDALTTSAQKANLVYTPSLSATDACDNGTVASPAAQTSETVVRPRQGSPYIVPVSPSSQRDTLTSDFHSDPSSNVLSRDTSSSSPHNFGVPGASTGPVRSSYLQQTLEAQTEAPQTTADPGLATARGPRSDDIAKNAAGLLRRGKTWSPVPTNEGFPLLVGMSTLISARLQRKQGKAEGGRSHSSDRSRPGSSSSPPVASRDTSMSGSFKSGFASPQIDDWSDGFTGLVDLDRKMRQLAMDESRRHVVGAQAEAWSPSASDRHLAAVPKSRQSPNDFSSPKLTGFTKQLRHRFSDRQQHRDRAGRRDRGNATSRSPPRRDSASSLPSHAEASGHGVLDMALSSGSSSARTLPLLSESAEAPHRRTAPHSALRCDSPSVMSPFGSIRLRYAGEASTQAAPSYNSAGSPGFVDEEGDDVEPLTPMPMPRPNYHEDVLTPNSAAAATWTDPDAPGYFPAGLVEKEKKEKRHAGLAQIAGSFSSSSLRERSKPRRQRTADGIYHQTNDGASQVTGLCSRAPRHSQGASNASSTNASSSPTFSTRRLAHDPSRVGRVRSCSEASSLFSHSGAPSKFTSVSSVTALQEGLGEQAEQAYINAEAAGSLPAFYSDLEARSRPETHHRASSKSESLRRSAQSLALGVRFKMLRAKRKIRQSGNAFVNAEKRNEVADGNPALIDTLPLRP